MGVSKTGFKSPCSLSAREVLRALPRVALRSGCRPRICCSHSLRANSAAFSPSRLMVCTLRPPIRRTRNDRPLLRSFSLSVSKYTDSRFDGLGDLATRAFSRALRDSCATRCAGTSSLSSISRLGGIGKNSGGSSVLHNRASHRVLQGVSDDDKDDNYDNYDS